METKYTYQQFAHVVLPLALPQMYTYAIPEALENQLKPGMRVEVQFGKQKLYAAIVWQIDNVPPAAYVPKEILSLIDDDPIITSWQMQQWQWIASYYMCTIGEVMQAALPAYFKLDSETSFVKNPAYEEDILQLSDDEYLIAEALEHQEEISLKDIQDILQRKSVGHILKSLLQQKVIYVKQTLHEKYTPKTEVIVQLAIAENQLQTAFSSVSKFAKQEAILLAFLSLSKQQPAVRKSELLKKADAAASSLESLVTKGILTLEERIVDRIQAHDISDIRNYLLSDTQQHALDEIHTFLQEKEVVLLHGITSSGKTLLYIELIKEQISKGQQVLLLLPEISLTYQLIQRIEKAVGPVAVYHSKFNNAERVEIWNNILHGKANVVIGARSAVFLPFRQLGLVIVDEEHDASYKQQDPAPRYQGRDTAIYLAHQFGAKVILGSATPSIESYTNAVSGKYGLVKLNNRYSNIALPDIEFISTKEAQKNKAITAGITFRLRDEILQCLANKEQVILFQNRRGYAPYLACGVCNWIPMCKNCDVSMTYHKFTHDLRCHYCGYTQSLIKSCGACGSHEMQQKGLGTERIEEDLALMFPDAKIGRMDTDTVRSKKGHEQIIQAFEDGEIDILVGTQMVTKGLDFGNVQLVGVLNADALLFYPDFRATEHAYQLLLQVSGRAGRRDKQGKVCIQISDVHHPIADYILEKPYEVFYQHQLAERKLFHYPPFSRLIRLTLKHKDIKTVIEGANKLGDFLRTKYPDMVVGPNAPLIQKINNYYLREILLKIPKQSKETAQIKWHIQQGIQGLYQFATFKQIRVTADVDCY